MHLGAAKLQEANKAKGKGKKLSAPSNLIIIYNYYTYIIYVYNVLTFLM